MDYRTLLQEENDAVRERYQLSMERIRSMETEEMRLPYGSYFKKTAAFILQVGEVVRRRWEEGGAGHADMDLKGLRRENHALYEDILPENYGESYANPDYAVSRLSDGMGQLLSFREKERNYILAKIGISIGLVLLIIWVVIIITGLMR